MACPPAGLHHYRHGCQRCATALGLSSTSVAENLPAATVVGTLVITDADAGNTHTYALVAGEGDTGNAAFTIVGNELRTAAALDFETQSSYSIRVRGTDQSARPPTRSSPSRLPTSMKPDALALSSTSVAESGSAETVVGTLTITDVDAGGSHTYALVAGDGDTGNGAFTIVGNELRTAAALDFKTQSGYSIRVRGTDQDGYPPTRSSPLPSRM